MKKEKKKTLKGSVLFTVVSVMALLIIFLTGTLALASATNNRAHKSYASSQANYTARAAIQSFTEAMQREEGIVAAVQALDGTKVLHPEVIIDDSTLGIVGYYDNTGTWQNNAITVELQGKDWAWYDDGTGNKEWHEVEIVKISATCRVGKEEETVSAVIKKSASKQSGSPSSSQVKGLQSAGDGYMPAGGTVTGGLGLGLKDNKRETVFNLDNDTNLETTLTFVNGSLVPSSSDITVNIYAPVDKIKNPMPYWEMVVNGNFYLPNNNFINVLYDMDEDFTQKQVPYLYVDGAIFVSTAEHFVNSTTHAPLNIFAGTIKTLSNDIVFEGADLYLMDEFDPTETYRIELTNSWSSGTTHEVVKGDNRIGVTGGSKLYNWAYSAVNRTDQQFESVGGNIYCNGNLQLGGTLINGDLRVNGDLVITQAYNVTVKSVTSPGGNKVGGNVVVNGTIWLEQNAGIIADGKIYCKDVKYSNGGTGTYTIRDNVYHPSEKIDNKSKLTPVQSVQRDYFVWDPAEHIVSPERDWECYLMDGTITSDKGNKMYYRYATHYAKNMALYKTVVDEVNGEVPDFWYLYEDQYGTAPAAAAPEGYVFAGMVDDFLNVNGYIPGSDAATEKILDLFIDTSSGVNQWQIPGGGTSYRVLPEVLPDGKTLRETSMPTDQDKFWYDPETGAYLTEEETITETKPYYTKTDYDGNDTNIPTTSSKSYYRDSDRAEVSEYEATHGGGSANDTLATEPYSNFGSEAYPQNMTREKIYGIYDSATGVFTPAKPDTKIVKNLTEVREMMDYDVTTGDFKTDAYPNKIPSGQEGAVAYENGTKKNTDVVSAIWDTDTDGDYIKGNCTIKGNVNDIIRIKPTGTQDLWILLDGVSMTNKGIIVDISSTAGNLGSTVNFMIKDTLFMDKSVIVTQEIYEKGSNGQVYKFKYDKDFGIKFYGMNGSVINTQNEVCFSGSFKCPWTIYNVAMQGKYEVEYEDEYGKIWNKSNSNGTMAGCPAILGNALFKEIKGQSNGFGLFYSESGGSGSAPGVSGGFNTSLGYYEIGYFSGS